MILIGDKKIADVRFGERGIAKVLQGEKVLWQRRRVPAEYQEVEYLESTGEQWIDTKFAPSGQSYFKIRYTSDSDEPLLQFGNNVNSSNSAFVLYARGSDGGFTTCYGDYQWKVVNDGVNYARGTHTFELSSGIAIADGKATSFSAKFKYSQSNTIYLFRRRGNDTLYAVKIHDVIIRDEKIARIFIPCYRKSDFKPGMYDTVTKQFFVNRGTGADFIVGPNV